MRKPWAVRLAVLAIVIVAVGLRVWGINGHLLWQDEAESAIYALQILEVGYPHAEFRGEQMYENRNFIPSPSLKYEFEPTNFYGSKFEKNKGWLPYYLIAASFKLFGVGTWQARLPSVLIAGLTILLVYRLTRLALPGGWSLLAAGFYAVNYYAIYYERQARYYSLVMALTALCLWWATRFRRSRQSGYLWATAVGLTALFHTHAAVAVFLGAWLVGYWLANDPERSPLRTPAFWGALAFGAAVTVPWMARVNFLSVFRYVGNDPMHHRWLWLLLVSMVALCGALLYGCVRLLFGRPLHGFGVGAVGDLPRLAPMVLTYAAALPLMMPPDSIATRLFLPLLPPFTVLVVSQVRLVAHARARTVEPWIGLTIILLLGAGLFAAMHQYRRIGPLDVDWIMPVVAELRQRGQLDGRLVLSDYHQFPLSFYAGVPAQLLYVLRCGYLRSYVGSILYLSRPVVSSASPTQPPEKKELVPFCYETELRACLDRLYNQRQCLRAGRDCQMTVFAGTEIYHCSPPLGGE